VSQYDLDPLDFSGLKTIPLRERGGGIRLEHFAQPYQKGGLAAWLGSLPHLLAADGFRAVVEAMEAARAGGKPILWGMGGHVIKCGLAPVLTDLMRRGFATAFAMNGSAAIHDFEIAIAGATSEDVDAVLPDGRFGVAEETGRDMNAAIVEGDRDSLGMGEALGRWLAPPLDPGRPSTEPRPSGSGPLDSSLLIAAYRNRTPVTMHVAIGTDTPHTHPAADPAAIGRATHRDFRLFCRLVSQLDSGGVYLNLGSAVVMPEVFLKAVSVVRNLGSRLEDFTTVNLDFLQHYRPRVNVIERPHTRSGGRGIAITGHHELMVPLLAAVLIERQS
jgi:hypothetical protein